MDLSNSYNGWSDFANSLKENANQNHSTSTTNIIDCPICLESFNQNSKNLVKSCCGHYYCQPCYDKINICALCRKNFNKNNLPQNNLQHELNSVLYIDYVFLDTEERRRFANLHMNT